MDMNEAYIRAELEEGLFGAELKAAYKNRMLYAGVAAVTSALAQIIILMKVWLMTEGGFSVYILSVGVLCAAWDIMLVMLLILRERRRFASFREYLLSAPMNEFSDLCADINTSVKQFGTVYLLQRYLFIPSSLLMIRYEDIKNASAGFSFFSSRKTKGDVCCGWLYITLTNGKRLRIAILEPRKFYPDADRFCKMIKSGKYGG